MLEQNSYRWRKDNGSETTATWYQNQAVDIAQPTGVNLRLRFLINASGAPIPNTANYQIQCSGGGFNSYQTISGINYATQTVVTVNTVGNGTWLCPPWVSGITVECWGGGGAGARAASSNTGGGGGGGGGYARDWMPVTPGQIYTYVVGDSGSALTSNPINGGYTAFISDRNIICSGGGGFSALNSSTLGAQGGSGLGDVVYIGGVGGNGGSSTAGGGGGGAGGPNGPGGSGIRGNGSTGGVGGGGGLGLIAPAGSGGTGRTTSNGVGLRGNSPGGGGGGSYRANSTQVGGLGNIGQLKITYTPSLPIVYSPSANIAAGAVTATTAQLTPPANKTTASFQAGKISDDLNPLPSITLGSDLYTELEWSLQATSNAVSGNTYQFMVTSGVLLDSYLDYPVLTIGNQLQTAPLLFDSNENFNLRSNSTLAGKLSYEENSYYSVDARIAATSVFINTGAKADFSTKGIYYASFVNSVKIVPTGNIYGLSFPNISFDFFASYPQFVAIPIPPAILELDSQFSAIGIDAKKMGSTTITSTTQGQAFGLNFPNITYDFFKEQTTTFTTTIIPLTFASNIDFRLNPRIILAGGITQYDFEFQTGGSIDLFVGAGVRSPFKLLSFSENAALGIIGINRDPRSFSITNDSTYALRGVSSMNRGTIFDTNSNFSLSALNYFTFHLSFFEDSTFQVPSNIFSVNAVAPDSELIFDESLDVSLNGVRFTELVNSITTTSGVASFGLRIPNMSYNLFDEGLLPQSFITLLPVLFVESSDTFVNIVKSSPSTTIFVNFVESADLLINSIRSFTSKISIEEDSNFTILAIDSISNKLSYFESSDLQINIRGLLTSQISLVENADLILNFVKAIPYNAILIDTGESADFIFNPYRHYAGVFSFAESADLNISTVRHSQFNTSFIESSDYNLFGISASLRNLTFEEDANFGLSTSRYYTSQFVFEEDSDFEVAGVGRVLLPVSFNPIFISNADFILNPSALYSVQFVMIESTNLALSCVVYDTTEILPIGVVLFHLKVRGLKI